MKERKGGGAPEQRGDPTAPQKKLRESKPRRDQRSEPSIAGGAPEGGGAALRLRTERDLTQEQAAATIGVSLRTWQNWEAKKLSRLGKALLKEKGWL